MRGRAAMVAGVREARVPAPDAQFAPARCACGGPASAHTPCEACAGPPTPDLSRGTRGLFPTTPAALRDQVAAPTVAPPDPRSRVGHDFGRIPAHAPARAGATQRAQAGPGAPPAPPAPAPPVYGKSCSGGATDPCQQSRCTPAETAMMPGALGRAQQYVTSAAAALGATPLADSTRSKLRWYFASDSRSTAAAVASRLTCIGTAIQDTVTNNRFGCHPNDNTLAYVCVAGQAGSTAGSWGCADEQATICITGSFPRGDRARAEVLIHEHSHRIGLSAGSHPDIYAFKSRFPYMSTEQSLMNSDSVALFAGAMTEGVRVSRPHVGSLSGGIARGVGAPDDEETWQARLYLGTEFRHPVLGIFNPTLGLGITLIGDPRPSTPGAIYTPSLLTSLVLGVRIEPPRPGSAPTPYLSLFGGPLVGLGEGFGVGAEAGVAVGFRWRRADFSVGVGRIYDPVRAAGLEPNLYTASFTVTFIPQIAGRGY